jgi:nitroreductase / dihydropteridine reductase
MGFIDQLDWRYATKKFDGKIVPADVLAKILEAIRMSPSAFGIQPYRVIAVSDAEMKKALRPHARDQEQITSCSHLLVFCSDGNLDARIEGFLRLASEAGRNDITDDPEFDYGPKAKKFAKSMGAEWAAKQAYIALGFALAACAELSVDSCPIEAFDPVAFKSSLNLPGHLDPKVLLAIGYRDPADSVPSPRLRFGAEELFEGK